MVASTMLEKMGFDIEIAVNGARALEALEERAFDLILMDCQMPEMNGYEATRHIRNANAETLNPEIPIIAMTAHAMIGDREKCLEAGMDDYIAKPVEKDALHKVLAHWLGAVQ